MRFRKSSDPPLVLNHQHGLFMDLAGTRPYMAWHGACLGAALCGKQCLACPSLYR